MNTTQLPDGIAPTVRGTFNDQGQAREVRFLSWCEQPRRTTTNGDRLNGHDCYEGTAHVAIYLAQRDYPMGGNYPAGRWADIPFSHSQVTRHVRLVRYNSNPGFVISTPEL